MYLIHKMNFVTLKFPCGQKYEIPLEKITASEFMKSWHNFTNKYDINITELSYYDFEPYYNYIMTHQIDIYNIEKNIADYYIIPELTSVLENITVLKKQKPLPDLTDSFTVEFDNNLYKIHKCNLDKFPNSYLTQKYKKDSIIKIDFINSSRFFYYYDFIENGLLDISNMTKIMLDKLGLYEYIKHIYYFKNNFSENYIQDVYENDIIPLSIDPINEYNEYLKVTKLDIKKYCPMNDYYVNTYNIVKYNNIKIYCVDIDESKRPDKIKFDINSPIFKKVESIYFSNVENSTFWTNELFHMIHNTRDYHLNINNPEGFIYSILNYSLYGNIGNWSENKTYCDTSNLEEVERFNAEANRRENYTEHIPDPNVLIQAIKLHNALMAYSKYHTISLRNYYILN